MRVLSQVARAAAVLSVPAMILLVVSPLLAHPWTLGIHNWDQMQTQRYVVVKSLLRFHQFPFWDPWECGGHPAWASIESAPNAVSPWLPAYLALPLPIAIRVEVIGSGALAALGCWMLAGRFTKSATLRALFAILATVNSRWGLQTAVGHTWHLLYGVLPWLLFLFDRAIDPQTPRPQARRDVLLASACLSVMVYGNAIYPVPHAAFALAVYATVLAVAWRSIRPLVTLATVGLFGLGLAAPKLLPLYEAMQRFPRFIKSEEAIWPWDIPRVLTLPVTDFTARTPFTTGMWHEWGLYLGWLGLAALVAGVALARGPRERGLIWAGLLMVVFVIGGFHPLAPWSLVHRLPIFKSQHVPSRWLYPAVIVLACAAVSGAERWLGRAGARRPLFEASLGVLAVVLAIDMGLVARGPIVQSFVSPSPTLADVDAPFHQVHRLPPRADYQVSLWDIASLPGVYANVGTLECDTYNGLHSNLRDEEGRMPGVGAFGEDDPDYRGEAYVAEGDGTATIASWTPNEVAVRVEGARAGDHVVLNQNWDPGWRADDAPTKSLRDAVSAVASGADETIVFRYRPRTWGASLAVAALTLVAIALWFVRSPRRDA
jgi:hypothetical protein